MKLGRYVCGVWVDGKVVARYSTRREAESHAKRLHRQGIKAQATSLGIQSKHGRPVDV